MMGAQDVLEVVDRLDQAGVPCWLDGGWGIDALLGEQTRQHDDLDLIVALDDLDTVTAVLASLGFATRLPGGRPSNFVLRAPDDRRVDIHAMTFDDVGGAVYVLEDGSDWIYPPGSFDGTGLVAGRAVACASVAGQILGHIGYEPDDQDRHDMRLLRERFGVALPPPYD
jgi:lincosamide nucleotidyltransferase A/C/D/E